MPRFRKFRLRPARPADAPALLALERNFPTDRFSARAVRYLLQARNAVVWAAEDRRPAQGQSGRGERPPRVVAALVLLVRRRSGVARVYSVAVSRRVRGRGLGAALLRTAEREARRRGRRIMSLEVRQSNRTARKLYASLGYRPHRRLPDYYEDGAPALRLRKHL